VAARVADHHARGARGHHVAEPAQERAERQRVVAAPVPGDQPATVQQLPRVDHSRGGAEHVGHLDHAIDEHERPHPAELPVHRLEQGEGERHVLGDRAGHVAQQHEVGAGRMPSPQGRRHRYPAGAHRAADRAPHVEPAPAAALARPEPGRKPPGERPERLAQREQFVR
jgi:hypothetical protein